MPIRTTIGMCACGLLLLGWQVAESQPARRGLPQRYNGDQRVSVDRAANRLVNELEHLQEDISIDMRGPNARQLYRQADTVLGEAIHFERSVQQGGDREHLYRDFQSFDRQLHEFLRSLESVRSSALSRGVSRVHYADDQLHRMLSVGDRSNPRHGNVIRRQAQALNREAQYFNQRAQQILQGDWQNQELAQAIQDFANKSAHFVKAVEKTDDPSHLGRDFQELRRSRTRLVNAVNTSRASASIYRQAQRIVETFSELDQRISSEGFETRQLPSLEFNYRVR